MPKMKKICIAPCNSCGLSKVSRKYKHKILENINAIFPFFLLSLSLSDPVPPVLIGGHANMQTQ